MPPSDKRSRKRHGGVGSPSSLRNPKHSPTFETIRPYAKACGKRVELQLV